MTQEVYRVTPHRAVGNGVAISDAYLHGCPILYDIERVVYIVTQHGILPCLQQRFGSAVRKYGFEKVVRQDVVIITLEAVAFHFGYETLSGVGAYRIYVVCPKFSILAYLHVAVFIP